MRLLLEWEAAEILRCSTDKVKRHRLAGKLPYIPGRPIKIREADLIAFVETSIVRSGATSVPPRTMPDPADDATAWALKALLKPKRKPRSKEAGRQ